MFLRRESARDGTNVRIYIEATYLGAVKQVPSLLEALLNVFPRSEYYAKLNDEDFAKGRNQSDDLTDVLHTDAAHLLECMEHPLRTIASNGKRPKQTMKKRCIEIYLPAKDGTTCDYRPKEDHLQVRIPIEPLKFEPRKLLSQKEQQELRERYLVNDERIILGGSLRHEDMEPFYEAVRYAHERDPLVRGMVVPRECDSCIFERHIQLTSSTHDTPISFISAKGSLQDLYSICDTAVIGDTLWCSINGSGQNPLEPAFYGKRIVSGRYHYANVEAFNGLRESGLLTEVKNQEELNRELARIVTREELILAQERAYAFIKSQQGFARKVAKELHKRVYE